MSLMVIPLPHVVILRPQGGESRVDHELLDPRWPRPGGGGARMTNKARASIAYPT